VTLLIFVRCKNGCILAADRKATADSGYSREEMKCQVYGKGWAVAGAGNSASAIQKLFADLNDGVTALNVEQRIADKLGEYIQIMKGMKLEAEFIVLVARNGNVEAHAVRTSELGAYPRLITAPFLCLGEETPQIVADHYVKRRLKEKEFTARDSIDVAPEVLAILKWACEEGTYVGDQPNYGLDIIILHNDGYYCQRRVKEEWAILKTDYVPVSRGSSPIVFQKFDAEALP